MCCIYQTLIFFYCSVFVGCEFASDPLREAKESLTRSPQMKLSRQRVTSAFDSSCSSLTGTRIWLDGPVYSVSFGQRSNLLAAGSYPGNVQLWDVAKVTQLMVSEGGQKKLSRVAFSPDGHALVSGNMDGSIYWWDVCRGNKLRETEHPPEIFSLAFSPDSKMLASGGSGTISLWDNATGKKIRLLTTKGGPVRVVAFSGGADFIASGGDDMNIHIWEVASGREYRHMQGHRFGITAVVFSPDSKTLVSAAGNNSIPLQGINGEVKVWDIATGTELSRFQPSITPVLTAVLSPDGKTFATVGGGGARDQSRTDDCTVHIWELATGKERRLLEGHGGTIFCLAFAGNGRTVASGGQDNTIIVWDTLRPLCSRKAAHLSSDDLEALWSDLANQDAAKAYEATCRLVAMPEEAVRFLGSRVRPVNVSVDRERIVRLISDLDNNRFPLRDRATNELAQLGEFAKPQLYRAISERKSPEIQKRLQRLLDKIGGPITAPQTLQALRAIEALEHIAGPDAVLVLRGLSKGTGEAIVTREANASLDRLGKRGH